MLAAAASRPGLSCCVIVLSSVLYWSFLQVLPLAPLAYRASALLLS